LRIKPIALGDLGIIGRRIVDQRTDIDILVVDALAAV
jgi:hypothetical protein